MGDSGGTPGRELVLRFEDRAALHDEYERDLAHGRAFVAGAEGLQPFSCCTLVLELADSGAQLALSLDYKPGFFEAHLQKQR